MPLLFLMSPPDMAIIFILALLVFGPKKLPEFGRQLGTAMKEFRKVADELTGVATSVRTEVESVYKPLVLPDIKAPGGTTPAVETLHTVPEVDASANPSAPTSGLVLSTLPPQPGLTDTTASERGEGSGQISEEK